VTHEAVGVRERAVDDGEHGRTPGVVPGPGVVHTGAPDRGRRPRERGPVVAGAVASDAVVHGRPADVHRRLDVGPGVSTVIVRHRRAWSVLDVRVVHTIHTQTMMTVRGISQERESSRGVERDGVARGHRLRESEVRR
jgi:hypothetical protein